jgi:hypothetical protein
VVFSDILVFRKETKLASMKKGDFLSYKTRKSSTTRQEYFKIISIIRSEFLIYLGLFRGGKSDFTISRIVIFGFLLFSF